MGGGCLERGVPGRGSVQGNRHGRGRRAPAVLPGSARMERTGAGGRHGGHAEWGSGGGGRANDRRRGRGGLHRADGCARGRRDPRLGRDDHGPGHGARRGRVGDRLDVRCCRGPLRGDRSARAGGAGPQRPRRGRRRRGHGQGTAQHRQAGGGGHGAVGGGHGAVGCEGAAARLPAGGPARPLAGGHTSLRERGLHQLRRTPAGCAAGRLGGTGTDSQGQDQDWRGLGRQRAA